MHELQLHAWNDIQANGVEYVVDLMDDAGVLYEKVFCSCLTGIVLVIATYTRTLAGL